VNKLKIKFFLISGLLVSAMVLTGCGSSGGSKDGDGSDATGDGVETSGASETTSWTGAEALNNPDSPLYTKVIYFDFDVSSIRSEYISTLRAHAEYLVANPSASVSIEGHCDERGSREYNIALGEQRSNALQRFFEAEGVRSTQISSVSYGEERPEDYGHSDAAWSMNRRAVLVY
jgi:peptidoglycan-associated lipoprotein